VAEYAASAHVSAILKFSWWSGVAQGVVAAFPYSLIIALIILLTKISGSDTSIALKSVVDSK